MSPLFRDCAKPGRKNARIINRFRNSKLTPILDAYASRSFRYTTTRVSVKQNINKEGARRIMLIPQQPRRFLVHVLRLALFLFLANIFPLKMKTLQPGIAKREGGMSP